MLWILNLQLAKLAGNTVVATCGGNEKAILLKQLGVDRVIDYKAEDIKTVCMWFYATQWITDSSNRAAWYPRSFLPPPNKHSSLIKIVQN